MPGAGTDAPITNQEVTHGVSNMTLHTVAIVLKQSVVFSMGRFLFFKKPQKKKVSKRIPSHVSSQVFHCSFLSLTSDTNFVVPSLNVFSMGVASA